jgi:hypothetical protein
MAPFRNLDLADMYGYLNTSVHIHTKPRLTDNFHLLGLCEGYVPEFGFLLVGYPNWILHDPDGYTVWIPKISEFTPSGSPYGYP